MSDPIRDRVDENLKHLTNAVDRKDEAISEHEPKPVAYAAFAENGNIRIWSQEPGRFDSAEAVDWLQMEPLYPASDITALQEEVGRLKEERDEAIDDARFAERIAAKREADAVARVEELERFLFPYAHNKEISGISWDGKHLIGDKASIGAFHSLKNKGEQIDVYKRAYDQKLAAAEARANAAEQRLKEAVKLARIAIACEKMMNGAAIYFAADGERDDAKKLKKSATIIGEQARAFIKEAGE